jgi:hypothetical protein
MTALAIAGIGVRAPGLADWRQTRTVLCGTASHQPEPLEKLAEMSLPATERRRANDMAHLAIHVAAQAVHGLPVDEVAHLPTIFSSADGDGRVLAQMLDALAQPNVALSPTLFHNSVFNAPGGYWSIASRSPAAATTLCAGDASFAAGLIEACAQVAKTDAQVLCVAFDAPFTAPLSAFGLDHQSFACALLLGPAATVTSSSYGTVDGWKMAARAEGGEPPHPILADFFAANAAAAALSLLAAVALRKETEVSLPCLDEGYLRLTYTP